MGAGRRVHVYRQGPSGAVYPLPVVCLDSLLLMSGCGNIDGHGRIALPGELRNLRPEGDRWFVAYGRRINALAGCVQLYRPLGYQVTFGYLNHIAGPFRRDVAALLRALDALTASRRL